MERNGCHAAIWMSILAVRTALPNLNESESGQDCSNLPRLENGDIAHQLGNLHRLRSDKLSLKFRGAILEEHADDLFKVLTKLVQGGTLRMRTGPAGDVSDKQPGRLVSLDDSREALHRMMIPREGPPNKALQRSYPVQAKGTVTDRSSNNEALPPNHGEPSWSDLFLALTGIDLLVCPMSGARAMMRRSLPPYRAGFGGPDTS